MASSSISLVAEPVGHLGPITITNSMILGLVGTILLLFVLWHSIYHLKRRQYDRLSVLVFWSYEALLRSTEEVIGDRKVARRLAPLAITMFFVIIINNWLEILPILGTITWNGAPLFRGLAADLNFTLSLAVITMVTAQIYAIRALGAGGNAKRYFLNPFRHPIMAFVGLLEVIAEFSRLVSLAMRLFGNIFGGEVLLLVIGHLTSYASPVVLPVFMLLELFVGAVQAYVFYMLTVAFVSLGVAHHDDSSSVPSTDASLITNPI